MPTPPTVDPSVPQDSVRSGQALDALAARVRADVGDDAHIVVLNEDPRLIVIQYDEATYLRRWTIARDSNGLVWIRGGDGRSFHVNAAALATLRVLAGDTD